MANLFLWFIGVIILIIVGNCIRIRLGNDRIIYSKRCRCIVVLLLFIISYLPIGIDVISGKRPYALYEDNMVDIEAPEILDTNIGELFEGDVIEQTFYCNYPGMKQINLYTQTYGRRNEGTLKIELVDLDNDSVVQEWLIDMTTVPDNDYLELSIYDPMRLNAVEKSYKLRLTASPVNEWRSITVATVDDSYPYGEASFDGSDSGQDLIFTVVGFKDIFSKELVRLWICTLIFIVAIIITSGLGKRHEK